jgi:hypothetical protein
LLVRGGLLAGDTLADRGERIVVWRMMAMDRGTTAASGLG